MSQSGLKVCRPEKIQAYLDDAGMTHEYRWAVNTGQQISDFRRAGRITFSAGRRKTPAIQLAGFAVIGKGLFDLMGRQAFPLSK